MNSESAGKTWINLGIFSELGNVSGLLLFIPQVFEQLSHAIGRIGISILFAVLSFSAMRSAWRKSPAKESVILGANGRAVPARFGRIAWGRRIVSVLSFLIVGGFLAWSTYAWYSTPAVRVFQRERVGLESSAMVGGEALPFAYIFDPKVESPVRFVSGAFVFRVDVVKDSSIDWANIDAIIAKVDNWEPVPRYKLIAQALPHDASLYVVELDKPTAPAGASFRAKHLYEEVDNGSAIQEWMPLQIADDKPRSIFVRLNAKTPGVYKVTLVALVQTNNSRVENVLWPTERILFDLPEKWEND